MQRLGIVYQDVDSTDNWLTGHDSSADDDIDGQGGSGPARRSKTTLVFLPLRLSGSKSKPVFGFILSDRSVVVTDKMPSTLGNKKVVVKVSAKMCAVIPGHAVTVYKAQGLTISRVAVVGFGKLPALLKGGSVDLHMLLVALSRVRGASRVRLIGLTEDDGKRLSRLTFRRTVTAWFKGIEDGERVAYGGKIGTFPTLDDFCDDDKCPRCGKKLKKQRTVDHHRPR
jgi:hypothetical protein